MPGKTRRCPSINRERAQISVEDGEQWKERRHFSVFLRGVIQRVKEEDVDCALEQTDHKLHQRETTAASRLL